MPQLPTILFELSGISVVCTLIHRVKNSKIKARCYLPNTQNPNVSCDMNQYRRQYTARMIADPKIAVDMDPRTKVRGEELAMY